MSRGDVIRQLHIENPTWGVTDIAKHLGCSVSNVCMVAQRYSIALPRTREPRFSAREVEVCRLYREGVKVADIAKRCGVGVAYVGRIAGRNGLFRNKRPACPIPHWVPSTLVDTYIHLARAAGEETAAHHVRRLKSEGASA